MRLGLAYLSEDRKRYDVVTRMSVRDNITMPSWIRFATAKFGMRYTALHKAAKEYVDLLKVKTPSVHQETHLLSGGNQQKVVTDKWLLRDCDILFFDEPTRGIAVGAKTAIYEMLQNLADQGKAIFFIQRIDGRNADAACGKCRLHGRKRQKLGCIWHDHQQGFAGNIT